MIVGVVSFCGRKGILLLPQRKRQIQRYEDTISTLWAKLCSKKNLSRLLYIYICIFERENDVSLEASMKEKMISNKKAPRKCNPKTNFN